MFISTQNENTDVLSFKKKHLYDSDFDINISLYLWADDYI